MKLTIEYLNEYEKRILDEIAEVQTAYEAELQNLQTHLKHKEECRDSSLGDLERELEYVRMARLGFNICTNLESK